MENGFVYTTALDLIRQMSKRKKIVQGGSSASKTFSILAILINEAASNPGLEISVVSESIPHLKRGAMKDFIKIMKATNRYHDPHWNRTDFKYTFGNKSYIEFFSVDSEAKVRGARRHKIYINEANNISYETAHQLIIRTTEDVYVDFNPTSEFWAHTELLQEDDSELLVLNYTHNEALSETIIKEFENAREKAKTSDYWANWVKVYVDGEVGILEGAIYQNWQITEDWPDDLEILGYGLDWGFSNDATALVEIGRYDGKLYLKELLYEKGLTNKELAEVIKSFDIKRMIWADSAEPKSIQELHNYGIWIMGAKKGKDSINFGINLLQNYDMMVCKDSVNLINEFRKYVWQKDKDGKALNIPKDKDNHLMDALRYFAVSELQNKIQNNYITQKIIRKRI